jgi:hypothetical protein
VRERKIRQESSISQSESEREKEREIGKVEDM